MTKQAAIWKEVETMNEESFKTELKTERLIKSIKDYRHGLYLNHKILVEEGDDRYSPSFIDGMVAGLSQAIDAIDATLKLHKHMTQEMNKYMTQIKSDDKESPYEKWMRALEAERHLIDIIRLNKMEKDD
jgi:hypothetical protein